MVGCGAFRFDWLRELAGLCTFTPSPSQSRHEEADRKKKKWASTTSPQYYSISSQPTPSLTHRASSESGLLLLSKSHHASTLLLALYYNHHGPTHYYPLLSQRAVGQSDKETYLAAATALSNPIYTVSAPVEELGYHSDNENSKNQFQGCGAAASDPVDEYAKHVLGNQTIKQPRHAFIHAQTYRMNAATIVEPFQNEINQRMWGPRGEFLERFEGRDVEKQVWAETLAVGCQFEPYFRAWENVTQVCKKMGRVYKFLFD